MPDPFANRKVERDDPAVDGAAVTPHDTNELPTVARYLWIGTTGNLALVLPSGASVTLNSVPVGLLRVGAKKVLATGTTAANIVALY